MTDRRNILKSKIFDNELALIQNEQIRKFATNAIEELPDYFFTIPASSTGKYHPSYTIGEGGLARHVRACVRIAFELFRLEDWEFTQDQKDLIIAALLLHDGWKNDVPEKGISFTAVEHPLVASREIKRLFWDKNIISNEQLEYICSGIETHMGQWNMDFKSKKEVLEKPTSEHQRFIHLVDYLASRKCLEMNFDAPLSSS